MARRGRPRLDTEVVVVRIVLRLRRGEDDDLIRLLVAPRRRAGLVKAALRGADLSRLVASHEGPADEEILDSMGRMIF